MKNCRNDQLTSNEIYQNLPRKKGIVVWLTGLPASGKSTLAGELELRLVGMNRLVCVLDGDKIRTGLNSDLGYSERDRYENIRRVAEVAAILRDTGVIAIVAFISPFAKMREFARERIGNDGFIEVFIKASLETCISRDPKGMYKKAIKNEIREFTGISSAYEEPGSPDLVIDTEKYSVAESGEMLASFVLKFLNDNQGNLSLAVLLIQSSDLKPG